MNQKVHLYDADMWARESASTWANAVTLARTVIGVALFAIASSVPGTTIRLVGLAVYWTGDMLDGWLAPSRAAARPSLRPRKSAERSLLNHCLVS